MANKPVTYLQLQQLKPRTSLDTTTNFPKNTKVAIFW